MQNKRLLHKKQFTIKLLTLLIFLMVSAGRNLLFAQSFSQTIRWNADPNVLEYKVEIQDSTGKTIDTITTENSYVNLSLKEGSYKYKITAYDLLGREAVSTQWVSFDILRANQPAIVHNQNLEALLEDGKTLELYVNVSDVTKDTVAELINVETGARIKGTLILSTASGTAGLSDSETHIADKARFTDVPEGKWKLVITNPSGLSSESQVFEVRDVIKEQKLAAQKAEEERLAREEAERLERERIIAEQKEAERLAKEQEEREQSELDEAEREEQERLAEEERLKEEEEEREREKAEKRAKWLALDRKFYVLAGGGIAMPVYDHGFFNEYMKQSTKTPILLTGQIGYLPIHTDRIRFGMELNGFGTQYSVENDFYKLYLNVLGIQDNLAVRFGSKKKKFWFQIKAGGGLVILQENLDILVDEEGDKKDKVQNFGYASAGGGLSLIFTPSAMFMFEAGADFYNLFIPDTNIGMLNPYLALGIRF